MMVMDEIRSWRLCILFFSLCWIQVEAMNIFRRNRQFGLG